MKMRRILPAFLLVLLVMLAWIFRPPAEPTPLPRSATSQVAPEEELRAPGPYDEAPEREPAMEVVKADAALIERAEAPAEKAVLEPKLAEIRGRFLFPGGVPAPGVALKMHGWGANSRRVLEHGKPNDWVDPTGVSVEDGTFSIRFEPPRAYQFTLDAVLVGYPEESWRWSEIVPGSIVDVGDISVRLGGSIRGRVVNKDGVPQRGFTVYADGPRPEGSGRDAARAYTRTDDSTGEFFIESMAAGPVELSAESPFLDKARQTVIVTAGDTVNVEIVYDGPDNSRRIKVTTSVQTFRTERIEPESIHLYGPGGLHKTGAQARYPSGSPSFLDLPPGTYSVEIRDPRFLPWRKEGIALGTRFHARLRGSCQISLSVVDATSGAPIPRYRLRVKAKGSASFPNTFELLSAEDEPPPESLFTGIPPGNYKVIVSAEGYAEAWLDVDGLTPSEHRATSAALSRGVRVAGSVVAAAEPVEGATVSLRESDWKPGSFGSPPALWSGTTDTDGRFSIEGVSPGMWSIAAEQNSTIQSKPAIVDVLAGEGAQGVTLNLPAVGRFTGLVSSWLPEATGIFISFTRIDPADPANPPFPGAYRGGRVLIESDGRFESHEMPRGDYRASIAMPDARLQSHMSGWSNLPGPQRLLGEYSLNESTVDLGTLPGPALGSLTVHVSRDGRGAVGCSIRLVEQLVDPDPRRGSGLATADTDDQGVARFPTLLAGDWQVVATQVGFPWTVDHTGPVRIRAGTHTAVTIAVNLTEHEVTFVDGDTQAPITGHGLSIISVFGRTSTTWPIPVDDAGNATLQLPVGPVRVRIDWRDQGSYVRKQATFQWTESGPQPPTVTLDDPTDG